MNSKKVFYVIAFFLTLFTISSYLITDSKLYYYGKSQANILQCSLPLELTPDFWGTDVSFPIKGFTLCKGNGLVFIQKGYKFENSKEIIEIKEINKYGFNNQKFIVSFLSTGGDNFYLDCYQKVDSPKKGKRIETSLRKDKIGNILEANLEWYLVSDDSSEMRTLEQVRSYSILFSIVIFIFVIMRSFFKRKTR